MAAILGVIEHIDEDVAGMRALAGKLKPGGKMLITVPAFPWMWSAHDVVNHHKRRYTRRTLRALVDDAGLKLEMMSWFNSLPFPLAANIGQQPQRLDRAPAAADDLAALGAGHANLEQLIGTLRNSLDPRFLGIVHQQTDDRQQVGGSGRAGRHVSWQSARRAA